MTTKDLNESDISAYTREELERRIKRLEARNLQLLNLLSKANENKSSKYIKKSKSEKNSDFSKHARRHILLKLIYLGWDHKGFAVQEDTQNTIEAILFNALSITKLIESRKTSHYHRCGRTDKGVSSFRQVISITVRSGLSENNESKNSEQNSKQDLKELNYAKILNRVLPIDVRILGWAPVQDGYSARFDCVARTYKYFFPLGNLDLEVMNEASQYLVGEHDFRNFCKMDVSNGVLNFRRKILSVSICETNEMPTVRQKSPSNAKESDQPWRRGYRMGVATVEGIAFMWHQIRAIMAVVILVGEGKENPGVVKSLLDVDAVKRKPQYGLANEIALNLYDTSFDNVTWHYDEANISTVISQLQSVWSEHAIKATMLKEMLSDLSAFYCNQWQANHLPFVQSAFCLQELRKISYTPLLQRPTAGSLEDRVTSFLKRRSLCPLVLKRLKKFNELNEHRQDKS